MKKIYMSLFLGVLASFWGFSQEKHLPLSKDIVGIWQWVASEGRNGELIPVRSQTENRTFKVINSDNTFYTMMLVPGMYSPVITFYGTYQLSGEGKFYENILQNALHPNVSGQISELRYTLEDNGNTLISEFKLENSPRWVKEKWIRISYMEFKREEAK